MDDQSGTMWWCTMAWSGMIGTWPSFNTYGNCRIGEWLDVSQHYTNTSTKSSHLCWLRVTPLVFFSITEWFVCWVNPFGCEWYTIVSHSLVLSLVDSFLLLFTIMWTVFLLLKLLFEALCQCPIAFHEVTTQASHTSVLSLSVCICWIAFTVAMSVCLAFAVMTLPTWNICCGERQEWGCDCVGEMWMALAIGWMAEHIIEETITWTPFVWCECEWKTQEVKSRKAHMVCVVVVTAHNGIWITLPPNGSSSCNKTPPLTPFECFSVIFIHPRMSSLCTVTSWCIMRDQEND